MRIGWVAEDVHDLERERSFFAHVEEDGALLQESPTFTTLDEAVSWAFESADMVYVRFGLQSTTYVASRPSLRLNQGDVAPGAEPYPPASHVSEAAAREVADFKAARKSELM